MQKYLDQARTDLNVSSSAARAGPAGMRKSPPDDNRSRYSGVPQVLSPYQAEAHIGARRITALGAGLILQSGRAAEDVRETIQSVLDRPQF